MKTCNICSEKYYAKGLCRGHYRKLVRAEQDQLYAETHKARLGAYKKEWRLKRKQHINAYMRKKRSEDLKYKISDALRNRFKAAFRAGSKKGSAVKMLGCDIEQFRVYIENRFQPGMTWQNYGEWHFDHIRPLSSFDLTDEVAVRQACNYSNLQPLWAADNYSKGARV